jgi:alpha-ketoglutarate-dependent taurine dioxygenase
MNSKQARVSNTFLMNSPFNLTNDQAYQSWKQSKLASYCADPAQMLVEVNDINALTTSEIAELTRVCGKYNSVLYRSHHPGITKESIRRLGQQLGLHRLDENICADEKGISGIQVMPDGTRHEGYIPYTDKPINWHTDGYYNTVDRTIRAMILHCVSDAASGGENALFDHEILYILMRDHDPELIQALMMDDAMSIPANYENGVLIRDRISGPVFSMDQHSGNLHMRYTARQRSIEWKQHEKVSAAVEFIRTLFKSGSEYILHYRLQPGEGIISNNVLHNRSGFTDEPAKDKQRLLYRARYLDRVQSTDLADIFEQGENPCCG